MYKNDIARNNICQVFVSYSAPSDMFHPIQDLAQVPQLYLLWAKKVLYISGDVFRTFIESPMILFENESFPNILLRNA